MVAKVDPDKPLLSEHIEALRRSGVDAVVLGGTQGITRANMTAAWEALTVGGLPAAIEVSAPESILPGSSLFLIPVVLNTLDATWLTGAHQAAAEQLHGYLDWSRVAGEGYIVMNPSSAVAQVTGARTNLTPAAAAAYAEVGAHVLRLPLVYVEYSGQFGDPAVVAACREALRGTKTRLMYGGGISTPEQAAMMASHADVIVVGNLVQSKNCPRLPDLVSAARQVTPR